MKFAVDEMMGKPARLLRLMGLDVVHERPFADDAILSAAKAENRIVLTRDRKLAAIYPPPEIWLIEDDLPFHQLCEIVRRGKIDPFEKAFTRCGLCNEALVDISKEEASGRVPPFVFSTQTDYRLCGKCNKIYWPGTHRMRIEELFKEILRVSGVQAFI